jgi:transposase
MERRSVERGEIGSVTAEEGVMDRTYIGIDAHSTQITTHTICISESGQATRTIGRYRIEELETKFLNRLKTGTCACIEAGSGSCLLARMIVAAGARAFVVHPNHLKVIFETGKKTDRVDAKKLADILMRHLEIDDPNDGFPEVFVPDDQVQRLRMLISHYHHITQNLNAIRNQMYSVFRQWLVSVERGAIIDNLELYLSHPRINAEAKLIINQLLEVYKVFEQQKKDTHELICTLGVERFPEQVDALIGISGVSIFGASILMADIVDIQRFKNAKKLTSYLHSAPRVDSSNDRTKIGHINKCGRKASFGILLQSANHLPKSIPALGRYKSKVVGKAANKIRAAMVGKTIVRIFYILKNHEPARFKVESTYQAKRKEFDKYRKTIQAA